MDDRAVSPATLTSFAKAQAHGLALGGGRRHRYRARAARRRGSKRDRIRSEPWGGRGGQGGGDRRRRELLARDERVVRQGPCPDRQARLPCEQCR